MARSTLFIILMFLAVSVSGQNISITFTGAGEASQVDSVTAINLRTGESVTLPGNETLVLALNTGISSISGLISTGVVFPNPFSGKATFSTIVAKPQTVYLKLIIPLTPSNSILILPTL